MHKIQIITVFFLIIISSLCSQGFSKDVLKNSSQNKINSTTEKDFWKDSNIKLTNGTGFFEVAKDENGVWWFVTPDGYAFYSVGLNCVFPNGRPEYTATVINKYGNYSNWAIAQKNRLNNWSYNTLGAWCNFTLLNNIPYTYQIKTFGDSNFLVSRKLPDIWNPIWRDLIKNEIENATKNYRNDSLLIGYWIDNEVNWGPDIFDKNTILEEFIEFSTGISKNITVNFLKNRYNNNILEFNRVWNMKLKSFGDLLYVTDLGRNGFIAQHSLLNIKLKEDIKAFNRFFAQEYFNFTTSLIRKNDPNHLILGVRFHAWGTPQEVIEECGKYCDVISVNYYRFNKYIPYELTKYFQCFVSGTVPLDNWMKRYYELSGEKPIIIGEFGYAARDSGQDKPMGAALLLQTQRQRANYFTWYVKKCLDVPYIIGYHWFSFTDKIKKNIDTNVGVVNIYDEEYTLLVNSMIKMNAQVYELHANSFE